MADNNICYIDFSCTQQSLQRTDSREVAEDSNLTVRARFDLCPKWDGLETFARFMHGDVLLDSPVTDGSALVPRDVLASPGFQVSLVGIDGEGAKLTSTVVSVPVQRTIGNGGGSSDTSDLAKGVEEAKVQAAEAGKAASDAGAVADEALRMAKEALQDGGSIQPDRLPVVPVSKGGTGSDSAAGAADGLQVESIGSRGSIEAYTDLDNLKAIGSYAAGTDSMAGGLVHCPVSTAFTLTVGNPTGGADDAARYQEIRLPDSGLTWYRRYQDGAWGGWSRGFGSGMSANGALPVSDGGTGKVTHTANALLAGNGADGLKEIPAGYGALYSTAAGEQPRFGTLPAVQGGTGRTDGAARLVAGLVSAYAGSTAPNGYLLCNGAAVSRTTYAKLFDAIGTTYGAGNGSTTFNVPNITGRFVIGVSGSYALASTGGEYTHTLSAGEMPVHSHAATTSSAGAHTHTIYTAYSASATSGSNKNVLDKNSSEENTSWARCGSAGAHTHGVDVAVAGGGEAHNNVPPYIAMNYVISTGL